MRGIFIFIVTFSFCTKLIQSSCLSYGHSCWGAHGKRASIPAINPRGVEQQTPPNQWERFKAISNKNNGYENQKNIQISRDDNENRKLVDDQVPPGIQELDMGRAQNDDSNLASKQMKHDFLYNPSRNRRRHKLNDDEYGNRPISLTPEAILTAQKIRLFDYLMKRDDLKYPRQKHV